MNKKLLKRQTEAAHKIERLHILQYPGIREVFILLCIDADGFTLYSVFDLLMTQLIGMTVVITMTVAAAMNISPMLLAACLRNDELDKRMRKVLCILLITVFVVLFALTFSLRYSSRGLLFQSTARLDDFAVQLQEGEDASLEIPDEEQPTAAQNILACILGMEPLATSVIAFVLSYEVSPKKRRQYLNEQQKIELGEEIDAVKVMIRELEEDMRFDLQANDDEQYAGMAEQIKCIGEQAGIRSRRLLAEKVAEEDRHPEAVEYLMEGGYCRPVPVIETKEAKKTGYGFLIDD